MRKMLILVDDTPSCAAARTLGFDLWRRGGAAVAGVTAVETSDIDRIEPAPLGGAEYAYVRLKQRQRMKADRAARLEALATRFASEATAAGTSASCEVLRGDVRAALLERIESVDLVIAGRDAAFHLQPAPGVAPLVEFVAVRGARPVVVVGSESVADGPVLVACDGSAAAGKALQLAALLGMFAGARAHLVCVGRDADGANRVVGRAREYLRLHGVDCDVDPVASNDDPAALLIARANRIRARMLVMGAFGHRGVREMLFGSCTRRLFDAAPAPLFIHH